MYMVSHEAFVEALGVPYDFPNKVAEGSFVARREDKDEQIAFVVVPKKKPEEYRSHKNNYAMIVCPNFNNPMEKGYVDHMCYVKWFDEPNDAVDWIDGYAGQLSYQFLEERCDILMPWSVIVVKLFDFV